MAPLLAIAVLVCSLLPISSSQNAPASMAPGPSTNGPCSAWLDLDPQSKTTTNASLNVCDLNVTTPLLDTASINYSQCQNWTELYLLIDVSSPQVEISFNLTQVTPACNDTVTITPTPPGSSSTASLAVLWTNSSIAESCNVPAEELLLSVVSFSITSGYTSADVCLIFFDPSNNATSPPSCVTLEPLPIISYAPNPLPASFKSTPVAVVNGLLAITSPSNITYAAVAIDPLTYMGGDILMVKQPFITNLNVMSFPNQTIIITGGESPQHYASLLSNVLFSSSKLYPATRLVQMVVCDDFCCSDPLEITVELVLFTVIFNENMSTLFLGNNYDELADFVSLYSSTMGLNINLTVRNSVLDNGESLYNGNPNYPVTITTTSSSSSVLITNCGAMCSGLVTSTAYINGPEPSYYNTEGDLIVRDVYVQLLDSSGRIIITAMLELDIVPFNNHKPILIIGLQCSSSDVAAYRTKRHSPFKGPYKDQSAGSQSYSSKHAPTVSSAILEFMSGHTPCLWSMSVVFSANTNAPTKVGLGTTLHLLPAYLNNDVVGVSWEDEHTLIMKVTGCWLQNFTGTVNLLFKPQEESCNDHTPCENGICFANRTGCPVRGLYRVQLGPSHYLALPPGLMILCLQFVTVGVVITSLLVMWQMARRSRRFVGYKTGEDEVLFVPKSPPQIAISITPPKQMPMNKPPNCIHVPMGTEPPSNLTSSGNAAFFSDQSESSKGTCGVLSPMSVGPPVGNLPGEGGGETSESCTAHQPEEGEGCGSQGQEVTHLLDSSTREGATVACQERLVPTIGALQGEGGSIRLSPSLSRAFTSPSKGHLHTVHLSPQKQSHKDANSHSCSSLS